MNSIAQEEREQIDTAGRIQRRITARRFAIGIAAASIAAAVAIGVPLATDHSSPQHAPAVITAADTPTGVLTHAARLVAYTGAADGSGPIRHLQFRNLTDPGSPIYDEYVRPDGTALAGKSGGNLEETDGYLTSNQLAGLPSDPAQLRPALERLAAQLHLGYTDEAPERAIFRLAVQLLPDPGVSPQVKAGIYRVIAGFDLDAVKARNLGEVTDSAGRPGIGLAFQFEEGVTEKVVLDRNTGGLLSDSSVFPDGKPLGGQVYLTEELVDQVPQGSA
jgi:hypothetical protein